MAGEIFISYRRADEAWARLLHRQLNAEGVEAWYDALIGPGQEWRLATAKALETSQIFVLLFSENAAQSSDIAKELAAATHERKLVVPVRLENIEPKGSFLYELASRNWVNAYEDTEAKLAELAQGLAKLVKTGVADESVIPFDRNAGAQKRGAAGNISRAWMIGGIATLALILAVGGTFTMVGKAAKPPSERTAFFGIDAPKGDPEARVIAETVESGIISTFSMQRQDTASGAELEGTPPNKRLERAAGVGATYAISGAAARQGDQITVTVQIEDAPSRTLLWAEALKVSGTKRAKTAATQLVDTLNCITRLRSSLARDDLNVVSKVSSQLCRSLRTPLGIQQWRDLANLAPTAAYLQAFEAVRLHDGLSSASPANITQIKAEIVGAADRAFRLGPNEPYTQLARIYAAEVKGVNAIEMEKLYLDGLRRAPDGANINTRYGNFLWDRGRIKEAMPYFRIGLDRDPLSPAKARSAARAAASLGLTSEARMRYAQLSDLWYTSFTWTDYVAAAIFRGLGDAKVLLADPPPNVSPESRACWADLAKAQQAADLTLRKQGAARAGECYASGAVALEHALLASAFLGDFDEAFTLAGAEAAIDTPPGSVAETFFDPKFSALRGDRRFASLMERQKMIAYWRESGKLPDFCTLEKAPVCLLISPAAQSVK